jgi:hypothetical protein
MPSLNGARPGAREVDFAKLLKVRVRALQHVHDLASLVDDLAEWDDLDAFDHAVTS